MQPPPQCFLVNTKNFGILEQKVNPNSIEITGLMAWVGREPKSPDHFALPSSISVPRHGTFLIFLSPVSLHSF